MDVMKRVFKRYGWLLKTSIVMAVIIMFCKEIIPIVNNALLKSAGFDMGYIFFKLCAAIVLLVILVIIASIIITTVHIVLYPVVLTYNKVCRWLGK